MSDQYEAKFVNPEIPDVDIDRLVREEMLALSEEVELVYAAHALHRTGRMARGIKAHIHGQSIEVTVTARNPETGYDYVGVTRFGHRAEWIYAGRHHGRFSRYRATVIATGRARRTGHRSMLRFVVGGRVLYRARVRGFKPASDWVENAQPQVRLVTERAMRRLASRIERGL